MIVLEIALCTIIILVSTCGCAYYGGLAPFLGEIVARIIKKKGGNEIAASSDMVNDAQTTATLVDQIAMESSKSNTSVEQLGNAMRQTIDN